MLTKRHQLAKYARADVSRCFVSLNHYLTLELLEEAYRATNKRGAAGIDGQTAKEYETELDANLRDLLERAKSGRYRAPAVRRVYIPKANGQRRPLGIPTFEDKLLQRAVLMILEQIYEQDFLSGSYGYRPRRSSHDALETLYHALYRHPYVIELDIESFFNELDKKQLRAFVRQRIGDGVICQLIDKWLKAGVMEAGHLHYPDKGTPQGCVISPLLANIYLHEVLDKWLEQDVKPRLSGRAQWVRFADDAVLCFQNEADAQRVMAVLAKRFARYGLKLHSQKTRMIHFTPKTGTTFKFLGFTHYWGKSRKQQVCIRRKTAKESFKRVVRELKEWCRTHRHLPLKVQHAMLCRKLRGHDAYYSIIGNSRSVAKLRQVVRRLWIKWLGRRSQKSYLSWDIAARLLARYPLPKARVVHSYVQRTFTV
jgi:group II intron reverse transcriptase/maturase